VQIQQVVVNLLKNAYEAMEENGAAPRRVRIKTYQDNRELRIAIADCGPGIRVTDQDIFAAFVTTKPSGMGMGLAISKTIVDAHGGRLWAESSHSGAAFHIALPTAEQIASEASELEGE
jgi:signal transduction histidine kinase